MYSRNIANTAIKKGKRTRFSQFSKSSTSRDDLEESPKIAQVAPPSFPFRVYFVLLIKRFFDTLKANICQLAYILLRIVYKTLTFLLVMCHCHKFYT